MNYTRRSIVKAMGLCSALPFLSSSSWAQIPNNSSGRKLGIALVGLGRYANRVAAGLEQSDYWNTTGIVTGSPHKIPKWKKTWNLKDENIFNYQNYDQLIDAKDIDVVYICLPNSMHAEFTIRAANAGKHVICEKPMAVNVAEAEEMVAACDAAGKKLAIGYRLHFNSHHQQLMEWGRQSTFGQIQHIDANFSIKVKNPDEWRLKKALAGGGSLMDVGIYCVQAARYCTGEEPVSLTAQFGELTDPEKFKEVEDTISWKLQFPSGTVMDGQSAYSKSSNYLTIQASEQSYELKPAYSYGPLKGEILGKRPIDLPHVNHQHAQMEAMGPMFISKAPMPNHISGLEGLRDMKILMAIYDAAENGKEIQLV